MVEVAGYKFRTAHDAEIMVAIANGEPVRDIAVREGISEAAVRDRRRRFELVTGAKLKRNDGRRRVSLDTAAA
jgi:hypothetical protein